MTFSFFFFLKIKICTLWLTWANEMKCYTKSNNFDKNIAATFPHRTRTVRLLPTEEWTFARDEAWITFEGGNSVCSEAMRGMFHMPHHPGARKLDTRRESRQEHRPPRLREHRAWPWSWPIAALGAISSTFRTSVQLAHPNTNTILGQRHFFLRFCVQQKKCDYINCECTCSWEQLARRPRHTMRYLFA